MAKITAVSPLAPAAFPSLPVIEGVKFSTAAAGVKYQGRTDVMLATLIPGTVIAGAFGVPPTIAGDLERATFNNVEQMSKDFTENVVLPVARAFECAMERDLLTIADRNNGLCIRFNLDATLRAAFKDRQEGLQIQRNNGIINANEWREI